MRFGNGALVFDCWQARTADLHAIRDAGFSGAIRYIDGWWPGSSYGKRGPYDKSIGPAERDKFAAAGLGLQLVWQTTAGFTLNGYQQGVTDGRQAAEQIRELGYPADLHPVYFAVDTNVNTVNHPTIAAYRAGFAENVPCIGCYGEADLLDYLKAAGLIVAGWLPGASSWSNGRVPESADVVQLVGSPVVGGITIDRNWVRTSLDLWMPGGRQERVEDMPFCAVQSDGPSKGTVWIVADEKRQLVSAADWPATAQGINELVAARVFSGFIQLSSAALDRVPTAARPATVDEIARGVVAAFPPGSKVPTADEIARAVVALLPPAGGGGVTPGDVRAAVTDVLERVTYTVTRGTADTQAETVADPYNPPGVGWAS